MRCRENIVCCMHSPKSCYKPWPITPIQLGLPSLIVEEGQHKRFKDMCLVPLKLHPVFFFFFFCCNPTRSCYFEDAMTICEARVSLQF